MPLDLKRSIPYAAYGFIWANYMGLKGVESSYQMKQAKLYHR